MVQGSPLQEMYGVPDLSSPWEAVNFLFDRDGVGGFFTGLLPDATQTIPFLALGVILSSATDVREAVCVGVRGCLWVGALVCVCVCVCVCLLCLASYLCL